MDQLISRRKAVQALFESTHTEIGELLKVPDPDKKALEVSRQMFDKYIEDLDILDNKILDLMTAAEGGEENGDKDQAIIKKYQEIDTNKRTYIISKTSLNNLLGSSANGATSDTVSVRGDEKRRRFHLPEVKLKSFGGNLKDWLGWWSQFEKIHEDEDLHATDKFQYLMQSMETGSDAKKMVESYPQTEENYSKAVEALRKRYGREDLQLQVYVRELLSLVISNVTNREKIPLSELSTQLESHLRCLKELQLNKADPDTWLFPLVESSLSEETLRAWQRSDLSKADGTKSTPKKSRLDMLMEFISLEVECDQQISLARHGFDNKAPQTSQARPRIFRPTKPKKTSEIATAAGLLNQQITSCVCCGRNGHEVTDCYKARSMTTQEIKKLAFDENLCLNCLKPGHLRGRCGAPVTCSRCSQGHHTLVCPSGVPDNPPAKRENKVADLPNPKRAKYDKGPKSIRRTIHVSNQNSNQCSKIVLMNTIKVQIEDQHGNLIDVRLVGDGGSQRSYATTDTIEKCGGAWIEDEWLQNVLFGGELTDPKKYGLYEVTVQGYNGARMSLQLLKKDQVTGEILQAPGGPWINELAEEGIHLLDQGDECSDVDILVGNDYWGVIRTGRMVKLSSGLTAEETIFGWTLGGRLPIKGSNMMVTNVMSICSQDIEKLWSLEAIGIRDPVEAKSLEEEEKAALEHFTETVQREKDGRFVVSLPWRSSRTELPTNFRLAEHRLRAATCGLMESRRLAECHRVFKGWREEGLIMEVPVNDVVGHCIPHRPVYRESSATPVGPVFGASCGSAGCLSLGDCRCRGPGLVELMPAVLLRFGELAVGVTADIGKAFQMLKVREADQPYQRFLWWKDESGKEMMAYQHQRVVFGMTSSPFLLGAVIRHHVDSVEDRKIAEKLKTSFYVDNLVTSVTSHAEYKQFRTNCKKIMQEAQMDLRQWASTTDETEEDEEDRVMPILGVMWDRDSDTLSCIIKEFSFGHVTKRNILSVVAQLFDPVGYLSPVMILPKLLVQEAWAAKIGWDKQVPVEAELRFTKWTSELHQLKNVKVPRYHQIANATSMEVHIFCDSSSSAMAAVGFLRTESGDGTAVQFLVSKSRLSPVKKPTIPRAELISCVLGVRIAKCIREALNLPKEMFTFWSDSSTALAWIARNGDWGVFVRNRVKEILSESDPQQWRHVPGVMNPADLPSRGCSARVYVESKWWEGPDWLQSGKEHFPESVPVLNEDEVNHETIKTISMLNSTKKVPNPRFSSYRRNVAVWGWVLRFIRSCRKQNTKTKLYLGIDEMRDAEKILLGRIQRESFPSNCEDVGGVKLFKDEEGILRVKTRLTNRQDTTDFICPILLPKTHPLVDVLIMEVHRLNSHGGIQYLLSKLREKYWIVQSRRVVRKVLRRCVHCQRHAVKNLEVDPAALPARRVEDGSVFATTGVDLAGPLFLKDGSKAWIVLYTCAVYRAIHLDVVTSLSTGTFLLSLERFISLYGRPNAIYSDNGTNFVGAANLFKRVDWTEIQQKSGARRIEWIFNPPTAAWWGGWWERLVRSVKDLLKRMLGRSKLNLEELRTCLAGVAATINDRPLTVITEDNDDLVTLTPAMFMRPPVMGHFPELSEAEQLQKSYIRMKELQRQLQHRFRKEYLCHLVTRSGKKQQGALAVGDVVLVGADNRKRFEWPLGVVTELITGSGGVVRVAKVKTANGILTRPLQRIYPLEVSSSAGITPREAEVTSTPQIDATVSNRQTRSGRVSKPPVRYGQWLHLVKSATGRMQ